MVILYSLLVFLTNIQYSVLWNDFLNTSKSNSTIILTALPPVTILGEPKITLIVPARKVCHKGFYDDRYNVCTYLDHNDEVTPIYSPCPGNATVVEGYCIGIMTSEYEKHCPGRYKLNKEELCIKSSSYQAQRKICPEGFELKSKGQDVEKIYRCVRKMYSKPIKVPATDMFGREHDSRDFCKKSENHYCPKKSHTKPIKYVIQCPKNAKLIKSLDNSKATCETKVTVIPDYDKNCGGANSAWYWDEDSASCIKIRTSEPKLRCPYPHPKLGPGLGDWDTPEYHPHPIYKCLAIRGRAKVIGCPKGYSLKRRKCYRIIHLPFEIDCKHVEGFKFEYDHDTKIGVCKFTHVESDYIGLPSYPSAREALTSHQIFKNTNTEDILRAYQQGLFDLQMIEQELMQEFSHH
ncbi:hypothetical protein ACR3K2_19840 [Cryptosporidium serpentis]